MLLQFLKLWVSVEIMGSFIYKKKMGRRCLLLSNFFLSNFHPTLVSVTISKGNGIINSPSSAIKGNQSEWTGPPDPIRWFPTQCSYRRRKKKKKTEITHSGKKTNIPNIIVSLIPQRKKSTNLTSLLDRWGISWNATPNSMNSKVNPLWSYLH